MTDFQFIAHEEITEPPVQCTAIGGFRVRSFSAPGGPGKPWRKRRKPSLRWEIIKVVVGGIAGAFAGQLFLWWVLGQDPFQLGPSVARHISDIVPRQFR